ncbi:hypothetical protein QQ045_033502 [Rhodiola kirilowii]
MESFFYQDQPPASSSWFHDSLVGKPSDFVPFSEQEWVKVDAVSEEKNNVKRRMVEMLRGRWKKSEEATVAEKERRLKHMVKEMLRRRSHNEGFTSLRAILPTRTKSDKISIITAAATEIMRTRRTLEDLRRRNMELKKKLDAKGKGGVMSIVKIRVGNPVSGIDSMVEVLHCLKDSGSDIRRIRAHFSEQELSAELEVDSRIAENEVEKAVQNTLVQVEEKILRQKFSMP